MDFVNRMDQSVDNYRIEIQMKKWWWSPFVWMVDVVLHGARVLYHINKREGYKSLPFLVIWRHLQCNFSEIFKRRHIILKPWRKWRYLISCLLWCRKTLLVQFEHRRIENHFKHLRWSVFAQTVNTLKLLTGYAKKLHLRCLKGFWICLCCKTRQV